MQKFLESLTSDGNRFADVVRTCRLDTDVPTCPEWTLEDLARHLGYIHRWVTAAVETCARPTGVDPAGPALTTGAELAQWLEDGVEALVGTLAGRDPSAPTWHPFAAPQVVG